MSDITLSSAVRQNLLSMQSTATMMASTQNRLATGKRVNSALDNPTNFFTASSLNSRGADLSRLQDSVGNSIQTIEAADNGIKAITKLVESAQGTARQALQAAKGEITSAKVMSASIEADSADATVKSLNEASEMSFDIDGTATTVDLDGTESMNEIANKISEVEGLTATVQDDGNGKFSIDVAASDDIKTFQATGDGATALGLTGENNATLIVDSSTRDSLESEFNDLLEQIDQLTNDASFNGNNFLDGDNLKVIFNETGSSSLTIKGVDTSAEGLGLSEAGAGSFQFNSAIEDTLKTLDEATITLRSNASTFGSNLSIVQTRKDFTDDMINTLESGAANLTLADTNEEGANLLALQTRQSLSTTALSMASQADRAVLSLF
ncbi:MAG: hypothetical protein COB24_04945 [Hyphomicrobiales bacterium]|nr:MAG: hypothetical protein COB24_04945 [Hyphomicrobiales bacterium]